MKQWAPLVLVAAMVLSASPRKGWSQEEIDLLYESGISSSRRPGIVFLHEDHNEAAGIEECNDCHHVYEDGRKLEDESSEDLKCADCHAEDASGGMPGLRRAFHLNCKGCHLQVNRGPVMCGQCHER